MSRGGVVSTLLLLVGTAAVVACGQPRSTVPEAPPIEQPTIAQGFGPEPPVALVTTRREGPSPFAGDVPLALQDALSRSSGTSSLVSATIGDDPTTGGAPGRWLLLTVRVESTQGAAAISARWQAELLLGAVAEEASAKGDSLATSIAGMQIEFLLPDGSTELAPPRPLGNMASGQRFVSVGSAADSVKRAQDLLQKFGLAPLDVQVLHPLDDALVVSAIIPSPDALNGRLQELEAALSGDPYAYEGFYLEIHLPGGELIAVVAGAFRTGAGMQWIKDGLEGELGGTIHH